MVETAPNQTSAAPPVSNDCDPVVIVQQPAHYIIIQDSDPLQSETFIEWSILNTICCLCTGAIVLICSLPALCFSIKTRELNQLRLYNEARKASVYARNCNLFATFIIIYIFILALIFTNMWHRNYFLAHGWIFSFAFEISVWIKNI